MRSSLTISSEVPSIGAIALKNKEKYNFYVKLQASLSNTYFLKSVYNFYIEDLVFDVTDFFTIRFFDQITFFCHSDLREIKVGKINALNICHFNTFWFLKLLICMIYYTLWKVTPKMGITVVLEMIHFTSDIYQNHVLQHLLPFCF